jgi:hemoglobin-like flavoprotein
MTASNQLIRSTFERAIVDPALFATRFKAKLFERDPSLRRIFAVEGEPRDAVIIELLRSVVDVLERHSQLPDLAEMIAERLLRANIQPRHYGAIGRALLDALKGQLGPAFTEEVHDAWAEAYVTVAEAVMAACYNPIELVA